MKQILILILILVFSSCKDENKKTPLKKVIKKYDKVHNETNLIEYILKNNDTLFHGNYLTYNKKGVKIKQCRFVNNKIEGKLYFFYENGKLEGVQNYKNNKRNGETFFYFKNGEVQQKKTYCNDSLIGDVIYNYESGYTEYYGLNDSLGRLVYYIDFHDYGKIKYKKGRLINCFLNKDRIKLNENLRFDCVIGNIPNSKRNLYFVYDDKTEGRRKIKKINNNYISVEELVYKKGKNLLFVIAEYRFNEKYHNQIIKDTAFIDYYVN